MENYYIASCVFTVQFPELSFRIQDYVRRRFGLTVVRCCLSRYKQQQFREKMPEGAFRDRWCALPDCGAYLPEDEIWSLCHNCSNLIEEMHPGTRVRSLWELIDTDDRFPFPDLGGARMTLQYCWRARHRREEQDAVRSLLKKMNIEFLETEKNREQTDFCGTTLYRAQPPRNPTLAPKFYREGAKGLFTDHTPEEQKRIMEATCSRYPTGKVVCYCHYCLEGLQLGGADGVHIAQLLFPGGA